MSVTKLYKNKETGELNLINPEVLGEYLETKLPFSIKFAPLCSVRTDLVGRAGDTLTLPKYSFIGYAEDVPEGADVTIEELTASSTKVTVKKAGKGVEVTDEAILSAYGDTVNEVGKQLLASIAGKVDEDCAAEFRKATLVFDATEDYEDFDKYIVSDMMAKFEEELEEDMTLLINPKHLAKLRRDPDFVQVNQGEVIMSGEVGRIFGCRVVISKRVNDNEAFLVKAGAVKILMKRSVMVEYDRNIVNKTNTYVVDEHYVAYLEDESKIVRAILPVK